MSQACSERIKRLDGVDNAIASQLPAQPLAQSQALVVIVVPVLTAMPVSENNKKIRHRVSKDQNL